MNLAPRPATLTILVAAGLTLSGCSGFRQPADRAHASAATRAACRTRADEVYLKQNRSEIYEADRYVSATRDSPFGATGLPGITTNGLSGRYAREQMADDCINAASGQTTQVTGSAPTSPASDIVRGTALPPPRP